MYILKAMQATDEMNIDSWVFRAPKVCFWHNMEPQRKMSDAGEYVHRKRGRVRVKGKMKHEKC